MGLTYINYIIADILHCERLLWLVWLLNISLLGVFWVVESKNVNIGVGVSYFSYFSYLANQSGILVLSEL